VGEVESAAVVEGFRVLVIEVFLSIIISRQQIFFLLASLGKKSFNENDG
jgi:hypothetical protein